MRALGYTPNPAARSLVTRRTDSVALVVPEPDERVFSDPFFASTLRGVSRVLTERDLQLVLLMARPGPEEQRMLRYLRNRHVDGALVVSHHEADSLADHLAALDLPCAFVGRPWTSADRVSYVDTDNVAGSRLATQALIDRGCRRIGAIAGPADMTAGQDRLAGLPGGDGRAGLAADAVVHGDFTERGGEAVGGRAARGRARPRRAGRGLGPDGASARCGTCRCSGRRVPDDVAVVGYDDLGLAEATDPPLTTVRNPIVEMAEQATRLLLEQVDGGRGDQPMRVIFPPSLVRRTSA